MKRSTDLLGETSNRARGEAFRACADRLTADGFDLRGYSLPQRVDDLEAARKALGYDRIDLVSESAGTRTAMIYAWRYPKSIHRSVMVAVNPPGHFVWDAKTTDEQIRRYAALCAEDASCRRRTPDLAASLHSAFENIPERWWFLPVREGNVKAAAFFGLMESTTDGAGPLAAPWTIDTLLSADDGDGGGAWLLSLMAQVAFPSEQLWGDVAAVARTDVAYARRFFANRSDGGSIIGTPGADLIWAGGELVDSWPANAGRERLRQGARLEGRDAPDRRQPRLRDTAAVGDTRPPAAPAERPPGRPRRPGPQRRLLDLPARSRQAAGHDVPGNRHGGRLALQARNRGLHARLQSRRGREDRRRRDARFGRADGALTPVDGPPGAQARRVRSQGERGAADALPDRARPRRLVPRRPDRARRLPVACRSTTGRWVCSRSACRSAWASTGPG